MRHRDERGVAMIFSLSVIALLGTIGSAMLIRSLNENQIGLRSAARNTAFYLAEAGIDQALLNMRTPADASDDVLTGTLSTGTYTIDSPAVSLGADTWQVTTHGFSLQEERRMEVVMRLTPQSVFQYALFGDQQLNITGSAITNSYDSALGPYGSQTPGHNGDIGTNSLSTGGVAVGGSIFVDGQIAVGSGAPDPEAVVTGYDPAFITGGTSPPSDTQDIIAQGASFPMTPVTVPTGLTCEDYTVNGSTTVTLTPPGPYCYRNLTVQGNATLTASGDVTVYITGELSAKGNSVVGVADDPTKMLFMMTATSGATLEQTITGSNMFYGGIYGPQAEITITGNADVYGAIVAQRINVSGSASIHYDEQMANESEISNTYESAIVSWRELN